MTAIATSSRPPSAVLDAVLERLTYVNEDTGYTVARVATRRSLGTAGDVLHLFGFVLIVVG